TIQRYLYVTKRCICTQKKFFVQLCLIIIFICLCESHFLFYYEYTLSDTRPKYQNKMECTVNKERYSIYYKFRSKYYGKISLFFYTLLPFILMIIFNGLLLKKIHQKLIHSRNKQKKSSKKRLITRMLLTVSLVFILLTSPASIYLALAPTEYQLSPYYYLQWALLRLLFYLCHSINFLLYCVSGSIFRNAFIEIVLCQNKHQLRRQSQSYLSVFHSNRESKIPLETSDYLRRSRSKSGQKLSISPLSITHEQLTMMSF
ncbi:unnamed protein product, partial [Didymodactylos carnosus]